MTRVLHYAAFAIGLAALGWVGLGYAGVNLPALAVTVVIAACYLAGALELRRYEQATRTLDRALSAPPAPAPGSATNTPAAPTATTTPTAATPTSLDAWLAPLHPSLRHAVRLRVEGERTPLPGPVLTPYLTGLLVLLGMLGTFIGMVVTLNGTGIALESATDLQAIRASLAAPVKGLGLAFGTSLAGVATSAMLGLLSALARRDRLWVAQRLDAEIASRLRQFSRGHQREESLRLLHRQADHMPALVDRLDALMTAIERQGQALNDRLLAGQDRFHGQVELAYTSLASSVERTVQQSLTDSARVASATLQPVVEATMAGIAREAQALHATIERSVQSQLEGLSSRFEASTATIARLWQDALAEQQRAGAALSGELEQTLGRFAAGFEHRSQALVEGIGTRLDQAAGHLHAHWTEVLDEQRRTGDALSGHTRQALEAAVASFEQRGTALLQAVDHAQAEQQARSAEREAERLDAWREGLASMAGTLRGEWERTGAEHSRQQEAVCSTLARTADELAARSEAQAGRTIAEIARLVEAASEAPRAAAEVIAELRQKLADGMARDNAMLEERSRILDTLSTLLDAVNHASREQRAAIDGLVGGSAELLERVGARFNQAADEGSGRMTEVAAQLAGSAVEVASLGDAFGQAVQLFGQSSERLGAQMERIESALGRSMARSDEQLSYYVAQAREVIDLSIMSQKQIVEDLQQIGRQRAALGSET